MEHLIQKQPVIIAIERLGRHVTAADISTTTGLTLASSTATLNLIAAETSGSLQVTKDGDIAYQLDFGKSPVLVMSWWPIMSECVILH